VSDKLAITLNTLDCGLFFQGPTTLTKEECFSCLLSLAIAAKDPTTLVCSGSGVFNHLAGDPYSWMRFPRSGDCEGRTFRRPAHIPSYTREALRLDLVFFDKFMQSFQPSQQGLSLAKAFLHHCRAAELDYFLYEGMEVPSSRASELRDFCSQALACFLDGALAHQEDVQAEDGVLGRYSITEAISLFFSDLAQPMTPDRFDELCSSHPNALDRLFELLCDLISVYRPEDNHGASPLRLMGDTPGQQLLIMAPLQLNTARYRIAMPTLLATESYSLLGRIFILRPLADERSSDWMVVSKSCAYGVNDLEQFMKSGTIAYDQKIHA